MPSSRFCFIGIIAALLAVQQTAKAQNPAGRADAGGRPNPGGYYPNSGPGNYYPGADLQLVDPDKKLAAGDEVTLEITQDREGGMPRVVTATGDIDVPPYGRVHVAGKTTAEAAGEIGRLLEKDYYYQATVKLSIDRTARGVVKSGTVSLSGEVRMGGPQDMVSGEVLTLSQAILKAGGFKDFADDRKVQVTRIQGGASKQFIVDVKEILKRGLIKEDPVLQDGDRINVPRVFGKF